MHRVRDGEALNRAQDLRGTTRVVMSLMRDDTTTSLPLQLHTYAPLELQIDRLSFGPGIEIPGYMPAPLRGYQEIPLASLRQY